MDKLVTLAFGGENCGQISEIDCFGGRNYGLICNLGFWGGDCCLIGNIGFWGGELWSNW